MNYYYVYILTNQNNTVLYIGFTNDLPRRIDEHKQGVNNGFTKRYNVNKLVYAEKYNDVTVAIKREKQLKKFYRHQKIDLINSVNPNWEEIMPY